MYQIIARKSGRLVVRYASQLQKALQEHDQLKNQGFSLTIEHVDRYSKLYPHNIDINNS